MKWYHSIKVRMIGFFVGIFLIYFISIIAVFSTIKPDKITESALTEQAQITANALLSKKLVSSSERDKIVSILMHDQNYRSLTSKRSFHVQKITDEVLWRVCVITLLATLLGYFALRYIFVRPLENLTAQLQSKQEKETLLQIQDKSEIGLLASSFNARTNRLIQAKERENKEYQRRIINEEMLMQQSKMAMMGEMMDSVAHQWKQPLNALTLYSELIRNDYEDGMVDKAYIEEYRKNLQVQIDHMVNTLDEFRSFFRPNKNKERFSLTDIVNSALFLAKDDIIKHHILVKTVREDTIEIYGYPNEFKHLILNIINNAKDAFNENKIEKRLVTIALVNTGSEQRMEICDNAGGIPADMIDHIFKANVTTKEAGKGTGIGLYMSQRIAQKHHATLSVKNREEGTCFIVTFKMQSQEETASPAV